MPKIGSGELPPILRFSLKVLLIIPWGDRSHPWRAPEFLTRQMVAYLMQSFCSSPLASEQYNRDSSHLQYPVPF